MSYATPQSRSTQTGLRHWLRGLGRGPALALVALATTKLLDSIMTAIALSGPHPISEANPVAAAVMSAVGVVPGLAMLTVLVLAVIVVVAELLSRGLAAGSRAFSVRRGRATAYLSATALYVVVLANNAVVLWSAGVLP